MKPKSYTLTCLLAATAMLVAACSGSREQPESRTAGDPDSPPVFTVNQISSTNQGGDDEVKTIFQDGTEVGLCVKGNPAYKNMKFKYKGGILATTTDGPILWTKGVKGLEIDAYYPYMPDEKDYEKIEVQPDQSQTTGDEGNYYFADALHAKGTVDRSSYELNLNFEHRSAKVIVKIKNVEAASLGIKGIKIGSVSYPLDATENYRQEGYLKVYKAIYPPRDLTDSTFISVALDDGNIHSYIPQKAGKTVNLESGMQYTYLVTVKYTGLSVELQTSANWTLGPTKEITPQKTIYVKTFDDFKNIANNLNGNYIQTGTIDMKGEEFKGIQGDFTGSYDGGGFKIINANLRDNVEETTMLFHPFRKITNITGGLFSTNKGILMNIKVEGKATFSEKGSGSLSSGVICSTNNGKIINCENSAEINADGNKKSIGGICGINDFCSLVKGCNNTGNITTGKDKDGKPVAPAAIGYLGGICGNNYGVIYECIGKDSVEISPIYGHDEKDGIVVKCTPNNQNKTISNFDDLKEDCPQFYEYYMQ